MPSNKKFGYFFSAIWLLVAIYFHFKGNQIFPTLSILLASTLLFAAMFYPDLLEPLNKLWFKLGALLGAISSPIVLSILFFMLITPIALLGRIFGRDSLKLKSKKMNTYWIDKTETDQISFENQF
jgi:flagellar biosynthesis protein FlhB